MRLPTTKPEHVVHLRNGAAGWPASDEFGRRFTKCEVVALCHDMPISSGMSIDE